MAAIPATVPAGGGPREKLWRPRDLVMLAVANGVALALAAWGSLQARDRAVLADQASLVAVALGGLVAAAAGNAAFLLAGKRLVACRAAVLLCPGAVTPVDGQDDPGWAPPAEAPERRHPTGDSSGERAWWWRYWDRLLAMSAVVAGMGALAAGWLGLSGVVVDHDQIPWMLGVAFLGLWLLGLAGTVWLGAALRDQWATLERIAGRLTDLGMSSAADIPAPSRRPRGGHGILAVL